MEAKRGFIRPEDIAVLERNWIEQQPVKGTRKEIDHVVAVRLYLPFSSMSWWITEKEPSSDIMFGLGQIHEAELGYCSLEELTEVRHPQGLRVLQDVSFRPDKRLSWYTALARRSGGLIALG